MLHMKIRSEITVITRYECVTANGFSIKRPIYYPATYGLYTEKVLQQFSQR